MTEYIWEFYQVQFTHVVATSSPDPQAVGGQSSKELRQTLADVVREPRL